MHDSITTLVALGPVLILFLAGYLKEAIPALLTRVHDSMNSAKVVEWIAEVVFEFSFIGGAIFGVFGVQESSVETLIGTLVWFALCLYLHKQLLLRKQALDDREVLEERHRVRNKTAGLVRSIVADEIRKSRLSRGDWSDC